MRKILETQKAIKIAQVIGNAQSGGVVSCILNFYRNIDRKKFQFDFFTYGASPYDEEILALGGRIFYISKITNFVKFYAQLKKHFIEENYFAVHAHLTSLSFLPLLAAKNAKIEHRICHAHSTTHKKEKVWLLKAVLKHFSTFFATDIAGCSMYSCAWLYGKSNIDKVFLLHNAIDLQRFSFLEQKDRALAMHYGWEDKKIIGAIGRLVFQKNFSFLIDAFAILSKNVDDAILVIVGSGKEKGKLLRQIDKLNLQDKVHILPEIKEVTNYYKIFDLLAMPSRFEGLPLVAVEAQAVGIPCLLSTNITSEVNISGKCEFLPIDKAEIWAEKMQDMLINAKRYDATRQIKESGYELKAESEKLSRFYLGLGEL